MVVVARIEGEAGTLILVAPVTHNPPDKSADAIEMPANVKKQLGLDRERSWIFVDELNRFIWPGPDIRPVSTSGGPFYDALPDWLFEKVRTALLKQNSAGRLKITKRTE